MKKPERSPLSSFLTKSLEQTSAAPRSEYVPQPRIKATTREKGKTNMTFFMSLSTHRSLKELAATRGISMQQLVAEFVDRGLAEAGEATFKAKDE